MNRSSSETNTTSEESIQWSETSSHTDSRQTYWSHQRNRKRRVQSESDTDLRFLKTRKEKSTNDSFTQRTKDSTSPSTDKRQDHEGKEIRHTTGKGAQGHQEEYTGKAPATSKFCPPTKQRSQDPEKPAAVCAANEQRRSSMPHWRQFPQQPEYQEECTLQSKTDTQAQRQPIPAVAAEKCQETQQEKSGPEVIDLTKVEDPAKTVVKEEATQPLETTQRETGKERPKTGYEVFTIWGPPRGSGKGMVSLEEETPAVYQTPPQKIQVARPDKGSKSKQQRVHPMGSGTSKPWQNRTTHPKGGKMGKPDRTWETQWTPKGKKRDAVRGNEGSEGHQTSSMTTQCHEKAITTRKR